jgi:uncharacterized tellurite resistance protein B-like protein
VRIDVSAKQLVMPPVCACCAASSETTQRVSATRVEGKRVIRTQTSSWDVPYCSPCCEHDREWPRASAIEILILTILTCGIYLYFYVQRRQRARSMCMPGCAPPTQAIVYLGWHGTLHRFEVASQMFAHAFLAANAKKVVGADAMARERARSQPLLTAAPPQSPLPRPAPASPAPTRPTPVPARATATSRFCGANEVITIAGRTLQGPLAYIAGDGTNADASTIVTSLRVGNSVVAENLPYWPTYTGASPAQRARYLDWHAGGRSESQTPIGYVFIHFYGLERRALVDCADHDVIHTELRRLLAIYGNVQHSFRGYASALMAFMALPSIPAMTENAAYAWLGELAVDHPTARSALLAWFHVHARPLPTRIAMQIASSMDGAKRGVAVKRARAELEDLFAIRYHERFGEGIRLDAAKRPETISYHPASPSLLNASRRLQAEIPHVLGRSAQFNPVVELWNDCVADLKKLGSKRRDDTPVPLTPDAWLALPPELRVDHDHPDQEAWDAAVQAAPRLGAFRVIPAGRLAALARVEANGRVTGARLRKVVEIAAQLGYAIEPDARVHARTLASDAELAIWETSATSPPNPNVWRSIHIMLSLTLSIALADGEVSDEEAHMVHSLIANLFPLDDAMRTRVAALRMLLTRHPLRVTSLARKLKETRGPNELAKIGRVLVTVAAVDGVITDGEYRALKSLYKAMGVAPAELAAAIAASGARFESDAPVQARPAQRGVAGEPIPLPPGSSAPTLNRAAIDAILAETREVASILSDVLDDDDDEVSEHVPSSRSAVTRSIAHDGNGAWSTLDPRYHGVLRELLTRSTWTLGEVRAVVSKAKLMPGAVLETVNAWSEERFGDYVIEEANDWKINAQLLERSTQ